MDLQSQLHLLEEENKRLREESQSKSDFLAMMVHQLRTPLAATKWIFKMMMDGDLGNITQEQRNIISRGFVYLRESQELLRETRFIVKDSIEKTAHGMRFSKRNTNPVKPKRRRAKIFSP